MIVESLRIMPKYLTISDDLQLIPGEGCRFLSKSDRTLDEVESILLNWLDENPAHHIRPLVNEWLDFADQCRDEKRQAYAVEAALKELEKSVRKCLIFKYRANGLSLEEAREGAARNATAVARKLLEE